ncbi:MAG: hypothetical protein GY820_06515 [Gammaproteobacteria bacterium]|nr:hypothetical protein [Gammaproteobacteria bacterium]
MQTSSHNLNYNRSPKGNQPSAQSRQPRNSSNVPVHFETASPIQHESQSSPAPLNNSSSSQPSQSQQRPPVQLSVGYTGKFPTSNAFLLTAKVTVASSENGSLSMPVTTRAFLDCGSQRTFITNKLAAQLNLNSVEKETLSINTFAAQRPCKVESRIVNFTLFMQTGARMEMIANSLPKLTGNMKRGPLSDEDLKALQQLPRSCLADDLSVQSETFEPDILIGLDYFWDLIEFKDKRQLPSGLYLIPSKLGLILSGTTFTTAESKEASVYSLTMEVSEHTSKKSMNFEQFMQLDLIGITDSAISNDDDMALQQFNSNVTYDQGRYFVTWPWKSYPPDLPDNYGLAFGRLCSLGRRFKQEPDLLSKYQSILRQQEQQGIIEKVHQDTPIGDIRHYLPHHPVITPQKTTTKVRIVYDGSAKQKSTLHSLNECLFRGPILLPDLAGMLLRFRQRPIAISADIEKAFLQVGLQVPDRDVTRFLWLKDPMKPVTPSNIQIFRFCHVPFGVISSPFLLESTIKYHLQTEGSPLALHIAENVYVDNVLMGSADSEQAMECYEKAKIIFKDASFNLREWTSNSTAFKSKLPSDDLNNAETVSVLGLVWNTANDTLKLKNAKFFEGGQQLPTKREILNQIASIFDPLGFISPTTLLGKLFMKELWKLKVEWDEKIPSSLASKWQELHADLQKTAEFVTKRHVLTAEDNKKNMLVIFVDASSAAYASVAYLRCEREGNVNVQLLFSKARLSPKDVTLPRLELLAMLIGVRAAKFIKMELKMSNLSCHLFSDSECVLKWLTTTKPLSVFVNNRVKEIHRVGKDQHINFHYVSTKENPADYASRGQTLTELVSNSLWWQGPHWLEKPSEKWPTGNLPVLSQEMLEKVHAEEKPTKVFETSASPIVEVTSIADTPGAINIKRFSSYRKAISTMCYVLRFIKNKLWNKLCNSTKQKCELHEYLHCNKLAPPKSQRLLNDKLRNC